MGGDADEGVATEPLREIENWKLVIANWKLEEVELRIGRIVTDG